MRFHRLAEAVPTSPKPESRAKKQCQGRPNTVSAAQLTPGVRNAWEVYATAVGRPVAAAACLSGDVIPAGTLAECRAFDGKERCCAASKDDEIGAAIRGLFPAGGSGSQRCRQLTQFFLCGTQCSAKQVNFAIF